MPSQDSLKFKIELFGHLIEELDYWHKSCGNDEDEDDELRYCEDRFIQTLSAVREMRQILLDDLKEYFDYVGIHKETVNLGFKRIQKQLNESTFEIVRG